MSKMHNFEDVPIEEIESGKYGTPLAWKAEPGDAVAFHGRTIHGAPGNSCRNSDRRVLSLRWLGEVRTNEKHKKNITFQIKFMYFLLNIFIKYCVLYC